MGYGSLSFLPQANRRDFRFRVYRPHGQEIGFQIVRTS